MDEAKSNRGFITSQALIYPSFEYIGRWRDNYYSSKEVKRMGKRNGDRSNSMNPNNPACQASVDNRYNQLNPNHPEYKEDQDED